MAQILITPTGQEPVEPVSIDTSTPVADTVSIAPSISPSTLPPKDAEDMSFKIKFGLPKFDKPYPDVYNSLVSGFEDSLRKEAASNEDFHKAINQQNKIISMLGRKDLNVTPEIASKVSMITAAGPKTDPGTVFERGYGDEYIRQLDRTAQLRPDTVVPDAYLEIPEYVEGLKGVGSTVIAQRAIAQRVLNEAIDTLKKQSWLGWGADILKYAIPLYTDVKMRGLTSDTPLKGFGTDLLDTNLEKQATELMGLPLPQYKERLVSIVNRLKQDNPMLAVQFAQSVLGRSTDDVNLGNLLNAIELTLLPGYLKDAATIGKRVALARQVRKATEDLVKSAEDDVAFGPKVSMHAGVGDVEEAAVHSATKTVVDRLSNESAPVQEALKEVTSHLLTDAAAISTRPSRNYRELHTRLVNQYTRFEEAFKETWLNTLKVERLPAVFKVEANVRKLKDELKESFPGINNDILDIKITKNPVSGNYHADFHIGNKGATHFERPETAWSYALHHRLSNHEIKSDGALYYIKVSKPLTETSDVIRDALITTGHAESPSVKGWLSYMTSFGGKYRTSEEILSLDNRTQRKSAVYAANVFNKLGQAEGKYIEDLARGVVKTDKLTGERFTRFGDGNQRLGLQARKQRFGEWKRIIDAAKTLENPATGKPNGYYFKSAGELEDFYLANVKRLPDDVEIEAYFAYKRLNDMDHMYTNLRVVTNKNRVGTQTHTFFIKDEFGRKMVSPEFDGVLQSKMPRSSDAMAVFDDSGAVKVHIPNSMQPAEFKTYEKAVKEGKAQVVRLYDPDEHPLAGFAKLETDKRIVYALVPNVKSKQISWQQVPRQEGGHHIFDADHYVKQGQVIPERIGDVFRHIYVGDSTIMPVKIRAMGVDVAKKLDRVRQLLREKDTDGARLYARNNLPMEWKEIEGWFKPRFDPKTNTSRRSLLNLEEKIQVVPKDKLITDVSSELRDKYLTTWKDGTKSGSLAKQYQVQFTGERDAQGLRTINNKGTSQNPLYTWDPAPMLDPISTMNRALSKIINTTFLDDYKIMSAEHWLQEAVQKYKALGPSLDEIRGAPFWHFMHPEYKNGLDPAIKARLEAQHYQIRQLWGVQSKYQSALHGITQKLMDSIYNTTGQGRVLAIADWMLPFAKDPLSVLRTMTFHAKLGIFALPQFIVQNMTYGVIYSIAGYRYASAGSAAVLMKQWSRINSDPAFLKLLDERLSKLHIPGTTRWKTGEFIEAVNGLKRSGFEHIQGEYAMLDTALSVDVVRSGTKRFLDMGLFPFREGERNARYGAWFTAYKEFRDKVPRGRLTEEDFKSILERADLLSGNMSRASSSALHTGVFTLTSQFLAYQMRLAEQLFGKRLTGWEKTRLATVNAALYGVPASTGLTGIPLIGDFIREKAINGGHVVGENWITSLAMYGIPAFLGAYLSGSGELTDIAKRSRTGNWFNIGSRLGNSGFETIREIWRHDPNIWKIVGGAPYSVLANTLANFDPFLKTMQTLLKGEPGKFQASESDMLDIINEISGVKNQRRLLVALHTGRWLSAREVDLGETSKMKAFFMSFTGLQDQRVDDLQTYRSLNKTQDQIEKDAMNGYGREYRRALQALKDNNPDQATAFFGRAKFYLDCCGVPEQRQRKIMGQIAGNNRDLISKIEWDFYINPDNVAPEKRRLFISTFEAIQKMKKEKREAK